MKKPSDAKQLEELAALTSEAIAALSYEDAMERLEQTVEALEQEGTPLELGLRLYEVGTLLGRRCGQALDAAEARMVQLLGSAQEAVESPYDPDKDGRLT
ncbi:MAG TPA: exodeoxyribonuclease VII small subunit [Candidatus Ozemobacteraceae bacterium]